MWSMIQPKAFCLLHRGKKNGISSEDVYVTHEKRSSASTSVLNSCVAMLRSSHVRAQPSVTGVRGNLLTNHTIKQLQDFRQLIAVYLTHQHHFPLQKTHRHAYASIEFLVVNSVLTCFFFAAPKFDPNEVKFMYVAPQKKKRLALVASYCTFSGMSWLTIGDVLFF